MRRFSLPVLCAGLVVALAPLAQAGDKLLQVLPAADVAKAPSHKYASMSRDEAISALRERGAVFDEISADKAPGVVAPVRLTARLGGVHVHGMLTGEAAVKSPFEIVDARLALALSDFAGILRRHGFDEVIHFSMYRPGGSGGLRKVTRESVAPKETSRHPAGLAIDVATLKRPDGTSLSVASSFPAHIGEKTCGEGAKPFEDAGARELAAIVCEAAEQRLFTYILTPNFNAAHRDHFHMEIKPSVSWMLVH